MKFRWTIAPPQPLLTGQLASAHKISPLLAQCLVNRGFSEPAVVENFLAPRLKNLADPFLLPNMEAAVARLLLAHERAEPLVIFGDYDVDGVTSTTILLEVFRKLGWPAEAYLPNRMDEGYGLSRDGVENCLKKFPVKLLLAVDCGSTAVETIAWLKQQGVETIVLDHHQVSNPAPEAVALVNPQLGKVFTELCSAGLAFKLAHALVKRGREKGLPGAAEFDLRPLLDLVALGTIADLVPLTGENRILVTTGLERLNLSQRPGILALKQVAQSPEKLGTHDVGFQLAPRLNAAGRLETAEESLHLLLAETSEAALPLAQNLDARNRERQTIEKSIVEEVIGVVRSKFDAQKDFVIVEGRLLWHIGVVGIVASRVLQEFYRPTFIIGGENGQMRGSGRSIAGFDLAAALRGCDDLLVKHGGHAMAAGLSIEPGKIDLLRERLNEQAKRLLKPEDLQPPLRLDAEVQLAEVSLDSLDELEKLKPTGMGNPALQFFARNLTHKKPLLRMGANKQHVKLWVTDGKVTHEAVWWNAGHGALPVGKFDLAFAPGVNEYNGRTTVQLKVLDWRAV
ncbi:MAG TPA: single-stranded-DNA-specific exonuclease RecJ [Candidatus Acidoferrales bacterium]|jgi:single-stranded-DNA-specific exonuclease|nr:single-stranded-DNA-specific exonuclease RecJ [Candidatus Acidoferrales bacterium]